MIAAIALAAAVTSATQFSGMLPGGGQYIAHRDPTAGTAAIELWYRLPSAGYDNANPGIARLAIAAIAASAPPHGTSLAELIKRKGGSLSFNVYADIAMVGASVPAAEGPAVLKALTGAYFFPGITDSGLKAALRDCAIASAEQQYDVEQTLQNALFARLFSAGPARYAPLPPAAPDYAKIAASDVRAFAARGLRAQNAVVSLAGNVDRSLLSSARMPVDAQPAPQDPPLDSTLSAAPVDASVPAPLAGIGAAWAGPPIADTRAATAMDFIADYLFDGDRGTVTASLAKSHPSLYAAGQFITLHNPGVLVATIAGSSAGDLRAQLLQSVTAMATPLDAQTFAAARNEFIYHILSESQTPATHADNAGWYAVEGGASYAPGDESREYLQEAQSLDPAYVASVAAKYLQHPAIVQLLAAPAGSSPT